MGISNRLEKIVNALPLKPGIRVLEIGCGPGVAAREIAKRIGRGYVLGIDRSEKAIRQALKSSEAEIESGLLGFRHVAIEDFELEAAEQPYDLAFAVRVGALDGRHPGIGLKAFPRIVKALTQEGKFFIDSGDSLKEVRLDSYREAIQPTDRKDY